MANEYRTWFATTEQEWLTQAAEMIEHLVGWYRVWTYTDTDSDRNYAFMSEGSQDDNLPPRLIVIDAISNTIRFYMYQVSEAGFDFTTGGFGTDPYLGSLGGTRFNLTTPGRSRMVANKDRLFAICEENITRYGAYIGFIDSFYSPTDDPFPAFIRGQSSAFSSWLSTIDGKMLRSDGVESTYVWDWANAMVDEGYPNPRNGQYSFKRPELYYIADTSFSEVRGRVKGLYYGREDRLAYASFIKIDGEYHFVTKSYAESDAVVVGPVSSDGVIPTNYGWPARPNLEIDYTYRGLPLDTATSGTLALWRFDTGHLDNYVYGSDSALPVPSTYPDLATNYDLSPQNSLTSVKSRLREAADFNGSTHYATATGDATSAAALKLEWTFECVFRPSTIPTSSDRATLVDYSTSGATSAENVLLRVSISPAAGATPDAYNVERGNIEILWEEGTASAVNNLTAGDFVQQDRWNYLAIVKKFNGSNYDIDVWHCSFGDHVVPTKKATFTNVNNAATGTSSDWYIGVDESLTNYFDGQMDDTRVTERVLNDEEIISSCARAML